MGRSQLTPWQRQLGQMLETYFEKRRMPTDGEMRIFTDAYRNGYTHAIALAMKAVQTKIDEFEEHNQDALVVEFTDLSDQLDRMGCGEGLQ